jgi:chemotaxis protein methyltransferase CheR
VNAALVATRHVALDDEAYHLLNELLERRFGLFFPPHRRVMLESRLQARLRALNLATFLDYYATLLDPGAAEFRHLANAVTNNETYFFRETDQFEALVDVGLVELAAAPAAPGRLRILSAGCSSGEEAFTLSFYADRAWSGQGRLPVEIDAFDLDGERVQIAQRGACRARSLRQMSPEQVTRYLTPLGEDSWQVRPAWRQRVAFRTGNLMEPGSFRARVPYDAVFCRNVLIYFSERSLRSAVRNLLTALRPGGLLFLGHSESLIGMFPDLPAVRVGGVIAYRREGSA